jgi:putative sigma-54 modulation protein
MKVSYRGIQRELPPKLQEKLDAKFSKLSKLLERRGEKEAHVVITTERHLNKSEITIQFYDHQLVGLGADSDLFTSMSQALDKLEKQALKTRTKFREKKRRDTAEPVAEETPEEPAVQTRANHRVQVFSVNHHDQRKPMTLEEALIELEGDASLPYMVYRDADRECVSVLVRRKDGNFDLIES